MQSIYNKWDQNNLGPTLKLWRPYEHTKVNTQYKMKNKKPILNYAQTCSAISCIVFYFVVNNFCNENTIKKYTFII